MNGGTLDDFCHRIVERPERYRPLHPPPVLAQQFAGFFGLSAFPRKDEITSLLHSAGVGTAVCAPLPRGFRGYHTGTRDGRYTIWYDATDWKGSQEHTLFHETYEIVRKRLRDLHPRVGVPQGSAMCRQADRFAAAALMQPYWFSMFAQVSGFDVVALHRSYGRAYSSLTIRLAEVMRRQPLLAVLYERKGDVEPDQRMTSTPLPSAFRATVVARTPGFRLRTQRRSLSYLRGLLPRRGEPPAHGSVAERVILTGRPVHVERVSGYDLWRADDVTVAARPVNWHGRLAKVTLVAVPHRDRSVLIPQLGNASFDHVLHAHQVI